jgi:hypothetical protein
MLNGFISQFLFSTFNAFLDGRFLKSYRERFMQKTPLNISSVSLFKVTLPTSAEE